MSTVEQLIVRIEVLEKQMESVLLKLDVEKEDKKPKKENTEKKEKTGKKEKTEKKEKKDDPKKKRGVSGYLVFAKEMRETAKDKLADEGNATPKPTEVLTQVAKMWRNLSDEEKEPWNDKAKEQNAGSEDEESVKAEKA